MRARDSTLKLAVVYMSLAGVGAAIYVTWLYADSAWVVVGFASTLLIGSVAALLAVGVVAGSRLAWVLAVFVLLIIGAGPLYSLAVDSPDLQPPFWLLIPVVFAGAAVVALLHPESIRAVWNTTGPPGGTGEGTHENIEHGTVE